MSRTHPTRAHVSWFRTRPAVANAAAAPVATVALADLTKPELSAIARDRGLRHYGTKAEILERLNG